MVHEPITTYPARIAMPHALWMYSNTREYSENVVCDRFMDFGSD